MLVKTDLAWKIIKAWDNRPSLSKLLWDGKLRTEILSIISEEEYASDAADYIDILLKELNVRSENVLSSAKYKSIFIAWVMLKYKLEYPQAQSLLKVFDYNHYECFLPYDGFSTSIRETLHFSDTSVHIEYDEYEGYQEYINIPWEFAYNQDVDGYNKFLKDEKKKKDKKEADRRKAEKAKRKREETKLKKEHNKTVAKVLGI